jgi:hypothetical protein
VAEVAATRPVKLFMAILHPRSDSLNEVLKILGDRWGDMDYISSPFPFALTDYYADEMGSDLARTIVSFARLIPPETIGRIKLETNEIEAGLADDGCRRVNLDPGYLDYQKVVLASMKFGGQKICVRDGVYADLTLYYRKGSFDTFPWTFPDFKDETYYPALLEIRRIYKNNLKQLETD